MKPLIQEPAVAPACKAASRLGQILVKGVDAGSPADGEDMAFAAVQVVDESGVRCPRADNRITFDLDGPMQLAAVCNGDATSLESFTGSVIKAFNGLCVAYLRSIDGAEGTATLTTGAEGLKKAPASIISVATLNVGTPTAEASVQ